MTLATHAVVGAAAAALFPEQPYAAFAAGFASHFALDALPHWDYGHYLRSMQWDPVRRMHTDMAMGKHFLRDLSIIGADAFLGFILTLLVARMLSVSPEIALVGAGAGIFPDLLQFVYFKLQRTPFERVFAPLQCFHVAVQEGKEREAWGWRRGLSAQILIAACVLVTVRVIA